MGQWRWRFVWRWYKTGLEWKQSSILEKVHNTFDKRSHAGKKEKVEVVDRSDNFNNHHYPLENMNPDFVSIWSSFSSYPSQSF